LGIKSTMNKVLYFLSLKRGETFESNIAAV
jgi:hypothetical protein